MLKKKVTIHSITTHTKQPERDALVGDVFKVRREELTVRYACRTGVLVVLCVQNGDTRVLLAARVLANFLRRSHSSVSFAAMYLVCLKTVHVDISICISAVY